MIQKHDQMVLKLEHAQVKKRSRKLEFFFFELDIWKKIERPVDARASFYITL